MPYKFHIIGLAKFRHMAILAIVGGYFGYFLFWIWIYFLLLAYFEIYILMGQKPAMSQFPFLKLRPKDSWVYP